MAYPPAPGIVAPNAAPSTSEISRSDVEGVGNLKVGALLGLLTQIMFWVGFAIFYAIFNALRASGPLNGMGTGPTIPSWITVNTFYLAVGLLAGGLVIGMISYIFYYLGFRAIRRGDPEFGAPTTLMLIGLISYLMTALGIVVIIGTIVSAINSAAAGTVTPGAVSLDLSAILGGLALIGLGAILALIGVVGLVLGNWRCGSRYEESMLKAGAILTIIPFVSIVGYVLLLVGYVKAGSKLRTGWAPPSSIRGVGYSGSSYPSPYGAPAPSWHAPPPPPPPGAPTPAAAPLCPRCGGQVSFIAQYGRNYCYACKQYV